MKLNTKLFATALAITGGLTLAGSAKADIVLDTFNDTSVTPEASWAGADVTITPGAGGLNVVGTSAAGYGYGNVPFTSFNATADGDNYVWVQFEFSVPSGNGVSIGPQIVLNDGTGGVSDSTDYTTWNENTVYTTYFALSSLSGNVNLTTLNSFNIGLDPEGQSFNITWMGVGLSAAPEPSTLALAGLGAVGLFLGRRRFAKA